MSLLLTVIASTLLAGLAMALGAAIARFEKIESQWLAEGFSAYRELNATSAYQPQKIIFMFYLMATLGLIAAVSGYFWLSESPDLIAAIMLFASGGILYSIFQDLAPQVKLEKHWAPPMGAVLGFVLGMFGFKVTES
jgi:ZIP family zinc transporter